MRVASRVRKQKNATATNSTGATVGYEAQLWRMADALRKIPVMGGEP